MRTASQHIRRFARFLTGETVYTHREEAIRWLTLLALLVFGGTALFEGVLFFSSAGASGAGLASGGSASLGPAASPTRYVAPTSTLIPTSTPVPQTIPHFSHIFELVLENTSYERLLGSPQAPYFNTLASRYGLATQFYAIQHPSLPNYFVLTAGTRLGVFDDCDDELASCTQTAPNLADFIEQSGRTWAAYFEAMPAPCAIKNALPYTVHYNPFVYYTDIVNNQPRCQAHVLPYEPGQFFSALRARTVPDFVWISPSLNDDMHEGYGTILQSDAWLAQNIPPILASAAYQDNGLLIITFDEGNDAGNPDYSGCCGFNPGGGHIATLLISPLVKKGYQSAVYETQLNLLSTIEVAWGLPLMGRTETIPPMSEFFNPPAAGLADALQQPGLTSAGFIAPLLFHCLRFRRVRLRHRRQRAGE